MMQNMLVDMDTKNIRYVSESSNASTSGYSTMSPDHGLSSPAHSPATELLQTEFSNLNLPPNSPHLTNYTAMPQNAYAQYHSNYQSPNSMTGNIVMIEQQQMHYNNATYGTSKVLMETKYNAELSIIEQPVEKFRFRYKSEMHGTHGSLNGANSKRSPKTYPEVELLNFNGPAVIRCSLFQTNLDSPHSHQLVVRKDDTDICDPHDLCVSPEIGFIAKFQNMGIIHTAKKFIMEELLKKKTSRLQFDLGRENLSTKEKQELHKATEKEAKDMNLNQVRLCFEAFKIEDDKTWSRIAAPVYTNPINNRKSAQTGELRIVRLSIAAGSVNGNDDLILLVEKVSKKNIKVRFFQQNEDDDTIWEAYGRFRESDVHHQYAIVCQIPAYKDKDIDKPVEVNIELVRPSDDERSFPPVTFRYKPRDSIVARKRRRTCSTATSNSSSGSSVNSFELPKTVQEQQQQQQQPQPLNINSTSITIQTAAPTPMKSGMTISEEFNKEEIWGSAWEKTFRASSGELMDMCFPNNFSGFDMGSTLGSLSKEGCIEYDGMSEKATPMFDNKSSKSINKDLEHIFKIYEETRNEKQFSAVRHAELAKNIASVYTTHAEKNEHGDSLIHEIILSDNVKVGIKLCHILLFFKQTDLFNRILSSNNESGLHYACLYDRALYIRPLLRLGCDPIIQDKHGNTALHIAVREENLKCIESFMNMRNLNTELTTLRNDDGLTLLHLAVALKSSDIIKKLLNYNASAVLLPNSKEGNNPLHIAVRLQKIEIVQMILNESSIYKQTLLTSRNAAGHTALDIAKGINTKTSKEIARLLSPVDDGSIADDSDKEPGNLVIKEEEMSSSSADEDDNDNSSETYGNNNETHTMILRTKEFSKQSLKELLSNENKFKKISKILNENLKWKLLIQKSNLQQFLCIWSNAQDMLNYIKDKNCIGYDTFITALAEVDRDALGVLLTPVQ